MTAPADSFRLTDRGRVAVGRRADLFLVDGDPSTDPAAGHRYSLVHAMLAHRPR